MKTFICISIAASMAFMPGHSIAAAQDETESLLSCIDAGFSKLMSTHNRDFSSQQFYIVCQYRNVKNREQNKTFTYYPPDGFKIVSADVDVALKSSRSSINDLSFQAQRATINLRCKGRPEADDVHDAVGVKLVGRLEYQPTAVDTKNIAKMCLKQILER